jgi:ABC-type transporter Mla subunit MlaD
MRTKIFTAIYLILLAAITFWVYKRVTCFYVMANFENLGPVSKSMPVYYKGFIVGKTGKVIPDADFKSSNIKIFFKTDMSMLPANVYAKVRKFDDNKKQYIEIEYPDLPEKQVLLKGSVIDGQTEADINSFMSSQLQSGALGAMSENTNNALTSVGKTADAATELLDEITNLVHTARPDILAATKNLSDTTAQINDLTTKLNQSAPQKGVNKASTNIGETIANVEQISENINQVTVKLNNSMTDVNNITAGLNQTLGKRFGVARLIVGTPVPAGENCSRKGTPNAAAPVLRPSVPVPSCK